MSLLNFLCFQLGWFASVLSAAGGHPEIGVAWVVVWVAGQTALAKSFTTDGPLVAAACLIGYALDSLLERAGAIAFGEPAFVTWPSPLWMVLMWANFAATLNHSLRWLHQRPALAAVLGGVGGPLAYYGGNRLAALRFPNGLGYGLGGVALEWLVAMPLLLLVQQRFSPIRPGLRGQATQETGE